MQAFTLPQPMGADIPFDQLHVWQWAKTVARVDVRLSNYLQSIGFVMGTHRLTEEDYKTLDHAIDAYHRTAPHMLGTQPLRALLNPSCGAESFHVAGHAMRRGTPSPALVAALESAGWIYKVTPETTYFEVINGRLFAKYQQIIGSRCMADLQEEEQLTFTKISNDSSGNPRYVVHFLSLNTREELDKEGAEWIPIPTKYDIACKRANTIGGKRYRAKHYGGGIVFDSYSIDETAEAISRVTGRNFVARQG